MFGPVDEYGQLVVAERQPGRQPQPGGVERDAGPPAVLELDPRVGRRRRPAHVQLRGAAGPDDPARRQHPCGVRLLERGEGRGAPGVGFGVDAERGQHSAQRALGDVVVSALPIPVADVDAVARREIVQRMAGVHPAS